MTFILYIVGLFALAFYQTILAEMLSIYGVTIDLAGLLVIVVAFRKNETVALWFAVVAAIVVSTPNATVMPWEILVLGLIALAIRHLSSRLNLETSLSKLTLLGFFLLIHGLLVSLVAQGEDLFYLFYRSVLPGVLYTLIFAWAYFVITEILASPRRVKESA